MNTNWRVKELEDGTIKILAVIGCDSTAELENFKKIVKVDVEEVLNWNQDRKHFWMKVETEPTYRNDKDWFDVWVHTNIPLEEMISRLFFVIFRLFNQ